MKTYTALDFPSVKEINRSKKKYKAFSFFSGMGGGSLGLKAAGFNVLYANEFIDIARETYAKNAPGTFVDGRDIRKIDPKELLKKFKLRPGELDMVEMSPPCKSFSAAQGRKQGRDLGKVINYSENVKQRVDDLFFEGCRMLKTLKPRTFIAENVKGLLASHNQHVYQQVYKALEDCGYVVKAAVISCEYLGVPQSRERLIFIGVRKDLKKVPSFPPKLKKRVFVGDVLPHISRIKFCKRMLPAATSVSPTITASDATISFTADFSSGAFCELDDGTIRKYKINELKAISGVPKDFKLLGTYKQRFERLGRIHVPVQVYYLAAHLAETVLEAK